MIPTFANPETTQALTDHLALWDGTPFAGHCAVPGVGVDCIRFAATVLSDMQLIRAVDWPPYSIHGNRARAYMVMLRQIETRGFRRINDNQDWMPGDLYIFAERHFLHSGILGADGQLWHCVRGLGVTQHNRNDPTFRKRLRRIYRLYAS